MIIYRNITTIAIAVLLSITTFGQKNSGNISAKKPNILFITVDDLKPVLGVYGNKEVKTPNIDRFAKTGVVFDNAYCQQAVCAASRISAFTGLRPDRTKVTDLQTQMRKMNPNIITMPQFFKANGYETTGTGKLMHGAKDDDPPSWSIPYKKDSELTYAKGFSYPANGKYQNPEIIKAFNEAKKQKLGWRETNKYLKSLDLAPSTECKDIPDDAYEDGAVAVQGIKYLEKLSKSDKPFFIALGFHKPHLPFAAPKKYWDMYDREKIKIDQFQQHAENSPKYAYQSWGELRNYSDIPAKGDLPIDKQKEVIHGYWASVSYVDAQIGKVLEKLKELGLDKNTIVVLWGDHGFHLGDHGLWCKHTNFEQATKVPFIIHAPGYAKNKHASTMTEMLDIFPTLVDYAGLEIPDILEGESLMPVLKDTKTQIKDYSISQYPRGNQIMGYSMRTEQYRLTLWLKGDFKKNRDIFRNPNIEAVELYDYKTDPYETISLTNNPEYAKTIEQLKAKLLDILVSESDNFKATTDSNKSNESSIEGFHSIDLDSPHIKVSGANYVTATKSKLHYNRFSKETLSIPKKELKFSAVKAKTNSGIIIRFKTSSNHIKLVFSPQEGINRGSDFAVLQNGKIEDTFTFKGAKAKELMHLEIKNKYSGKETLYEVVLPSWADVALTQFVLNENSELVSFELPKKQVYMAIGNSITHGVGQGSASHLTYPYLLAQKLNANYYNLAVGGAKVSPAIAKMTAEMPKADIITILIGYNDMVGSSKTVDKYIADYKAYLTEIRKNQPEAKIYCISVTYTKTLKNEKTGHTPDEFRTALQELINEFITEGNKKMIFVAGDKITSKENLRAEQPKDKVHFGVKGSELFANELYKIISDKKH